MKNKRPRKPVPSFFVPIVWGLFWLGVVVCAGMAGAATGSLLGYLSEQPPIERLENYDPPQVTEVFDRTGRHQIATLYEEKREVIPFSKMPQRLIDAFLAVEDVRFYEHYGIDPKGIARAIWIYLQTGRFRQGASTITMQTARNMIPELEKRKLERSWERKVLEAFAALHMEKNFSKDQILEFYLNHIEFSQLTHGVQSAARTYFGKPVTDLSIGECAVLAAIPKAPTTYNPFLHPDRAAKRRNLILDQMEDHGMIDKATAEREKAAPLMVATGLKPRFTSPYFKDYVEQCIRSNPDLGKKFLFQGGHRIYSTMDTEFQQIIEEELTRGLPGVEKEWQKSKPKRLQREIRELQKEGKSILPAAKQERLARILQVKHNGVQVDIQGYQGFAPFEKKMQYSNEKKKWIWDGEYLKPYYDPEAVLEEGKLIDVFVKKVYPRSRKMEVAIADYKIDQGIAHAARIQGAAVLLDGKTGQLLAVSGGYDYFDHLSDGMFNRATQGGRQAGSAFKPLLYAIALDKGMTAGKVIMDTWTVYDKGYTPRNYENKYFGPTTLLEALTHSRNVVTVKLFRLIGVERSLQAYRAFDITKPRQTWNLPPELSVCLGSMNATPLSIAAAYSAFVRKGIATEPVCFTRITDLQGQPVGEIQPRENRAVSPQAAYITTCMLMEVMRTGTGENIYKNFNPVKTPQMAGKTGTTTNNVDAWFVGYTPDLILAVCVGFDRSRSLGPEMTGSKAAGPIWTKMMQRFLATRTEWTMQFEVPKDIVFRDIDRATGYLATGGGAAKSVPFVKGTEPRGYSQGYSGPEYWKFQHPDPEKNQITDPSNIPPELLEQLQQSGGGSPDESYGSDEVQQEYDGSSSGEAPPSDSSERFVEPDGSGEEDPLDDDFIAPPWE